jgi:putative hemolysin
MVKQHPNPSTSGIVKAQGFKGFNPLEELSGYRRLQKLYSELATNQGENFLASFLDKIELEITWEGKGKNQIPEKGAFITISNHPFGILGEIILLEYLRRKRPDFKIMANHPDFHTTWVKNECILNHANGLPVSPREEDNHFDSVASHLASGRPIGIFPATEVSVFQRENRRITDKAWHKPLVKLIKAAHVPVIPMYFEGSNRLWGQIMGLILPDFKKITIPSEVFSQKKKQVKVYIGSPIPAKELNKIDDVDRLGRYLRARTYSLASGLKVKPFFRPNFKFSAQIPPIAKSVPSDIIESEIKNFPSENLLCSQAEFEVYIADAQQIPMILQELGRLREEMFREVGEGTGLSIDTDEYDLYYRHLFLWDKEKRQIVGAYRMGLGQEIIRFYGKKGFYLHSLFKMKNGFVPYLDKSIELGRSFIKSSYQRQRLPLYLLWKGIYTYLARNPHYDYLIGPVSISQAYSQLSRDLIVALIKAYHFDNDLAGYIKPRKRFSPKIKRVDVADLVEVIEDNLRLADKIISEIEPQHLKLPILLKKYIKQNARIIGFNVDPKFNSCLDGFIILDINEIPEVTIQSMNR